MRTYVGGQRAVSVLDELDGAAAFEDFRELFLGPVNESAEEGTVRREVARAVLAELLADSADDEISMLNAVYAAQLSSLASPGRVAPASRVGSVAA